MIYAAPGSSFAARVDGFPTGLAGTVGVQILDSTGAVIVARATAGITESPAFSGSYIVTLTAPTTSGQYSVFWDSGVTSPSTTAAEGLTVTASQVVTGGTPLYITLAGLKVTLGIGNTSYDADLNASISAACRAVDRICQRRFYLDADANQVRYYSPVDPRLQEIADVAVVTSLQSADDGTTTYANSWTLNSDYVLEPLNAGSDAEVWPWTHLRVHPLGLFRFNTFYPRSVKVTGQFGWPQVPGPIIDASTLLAERLFKMKREAPLGILAFADVAVRVARADSNLMVNLSGYQKRVAGIA